MEAHRMRGRSRWQLVRVCIEGSGMHPLKLTLKETGRVYIIGRHVNNSTRLVHYPMKSEYISKQHCQIRFRNGVWAISDMNSRNGTYVNDQLLPRSISRDLNENDIIRLGKFELSPTLPNLDTYFVFRFTRAETEFNETFHSESEIEIIDLVEEDIQPITPQECFQTEKQNDAEENKCISVAASIIAKRGDCGDNEKLHISEIATSKNERAAPRIDESTVLNKCVAEKVEAIPCLCEKQSALNGFPADRTLENNYNKGLSAAEIAASMDNVENEPFDTCTMEIIAMARKNQEVYEQKRLQKKSLVSQNDENQKQPGLQRSGGKRKSASSPHGGAAEDFQVASNGKNETRKQCLKDVTEIKEQENHPVVFSSNNEGRNADKEESNMAECDSEVRSEDPEPSESDQNNSNKAQNQCKLKRKTSDELINVEAPPKRKLNENPVDSGTCKAESSMNISASGAKSSAEVTKNTTSLNSRRPSTEADLNSVIKVISHRSSQTSERSTILLPSAPPKKSRRTYPQPTKKPPRKVTNSTVSIDYKPRPPASKRPAIKTKMTKISRSDRLQNSVEEAHAKTLKQQTMRNPVDVTARQIDNNNLENIIESPAPSAGSLAHIVVDDTTRPFQQNSKKFRSDEVNHPRVESLESKNPLLNLNGTEETRVPTLPLENQGSLVIRQSSSHMYYGSELPGEILCSSFQSDSEENNPLLGDLLDAALILNTICVTLWNRIDPMTVTLEVLKQLLTEYGVHEWLLNIFDSSNIQEYSAQDKDIVSVETLPRALLKFYVPVFTEGDGNCFYRAVSHSIFGREDFHIMVRLRILLDVLLHQRGYEKFTSLAVTEDNYAELVKSVSQNGVWAGDAVIYAASKILHRPIHIYTEFPLAPSNMDEFCKYMENPHNKCHRKVLFEDYDAEKFPLCVHYRGYNRGDAKNHFVALVPAPGNRLVFPCNMDEYVRLRNFGRNGTY